MSRVSKATVERRQIEALIATPNATEGIAPLGDISSVLYCALRVKSPSSERLVDGRVWCAEQDGSVSVRDAVDGKLLVKKESFIPAKGKTFVKCMVANATLVWCGYSDGNLRAYTLDATLEFERKRHAGCINDLVFAADGDLLCSASDDFRIGIWSSKDALFLHHLPGHSSGVKSLAVDGNFLFSGGSDGCLRCWNVTEKAEVIAEERYPLFAHKGGVKTVIVSDNVAFTGGEDGVCLWDIETTELIHSFTTTAPVVKIAIIDADVALWVATIDGAITVWDLFNFSLVGRIKQHKTSGVNDIVTASRSVASKLFTQSANTLNVTYHESDGMPSEYDAVTEEVADLHKKIDELRLNVVRNAETLRERAKSLRQLQQLDEHRKAAITETLREAMRNSVKRTYFDNALTFLKKRQYQQKRTVLASTMLQNTSRGLMFLYLNKWLKFQRFRKDKRQREIMVESLLRTTQRGLQSMYLQQALEYVREKESSEARLHAAEAIMQHTERGQQRIVLYKWIRFVKRQQHLGKRKGIYQNLQRTTQHGLMSIYLNKFLNFTKIVQRRRVRSAAADLLLSTTQTGLKHVSIMRWRAAITKKKQVIQKRKLADTMGRCTESGLSLTYFSKLVAFTKSKKQQSLDEKIEALDSRIEELEKLINDPEILDEAELDKQIASAQEEIDTLEAEIEEARSCIADLENRERELKRELAESAAIDPDKPLSVQVESACQVLKGKGISCKNHTDLVNDVKKRVAAKPPQPCAIFTSSMNKFRAACEPFAEEGQELKSGELWSLNSEKINSLSKQTLKRTLAGAREAIVAWDAVTSLKAYPEQGELVGAADIIVNGTWIMQMIAREPTAADEKPDSPRSKTGTARRSSTPTSSTRRSSTPASPTARRPSGTTTTKSKAPAAKTSTRSTAAKPAPKK